MSTLNYQSSESGYEGGYGRSYFTAAYSSDGNPAESAPVEEPVSATHLVEGPGYEERVRPAADFPRRWVFRSWGDAAPSFAANGTFWKEEKGAPTEEAGGTPEDFAEKLSSGDSHLVPLARSLLGKIHARVEIPTPVDRTQRSVSGSRVHVPSYCAGTPKAMLRRNPAAESVAGPIRVFVGLAAASRVSRKTIELRGAAVLALVLALQRLRPVNLSVFASARTRRLGRDVVAVMPVSTTPIDLSRVCFALTNPGMVRRWLGTVLVRLAGMREDPLLISRVPPSELLDVSSQDIVLGTEMSGTNHFRSVDAAAAWVQDRIDHALGDSE